MGGRMSRSVARRSIAIFVKLIQQLHARRTRRRLGVVARRGRMGGRMSRSVAKKSIAVFVKLIQASLL